MWMVILIAGYVLAAVSFAGCSLRVALRSTTQPERRAVAYKAFRVVWSTGLVGVAAAAVKLHDVGLI